MKTCIFSLAIGIILLLSRPTAGDTGALNTAVTLAGKLAEGALSGVQSKVSNYFYTAQQPEDPTVGSVLFINDDAVCSVHVTLYTKSVWTSDGLTQWNAYNTGTGAINNTITFDKYTSSGLVHTLPNVSPFAIRVEGTTMAAGVSFLTERTCTYNQLFTGLEFGQDNPQCYHNYRNRDSAMICDFTIGGSSQRPIPTLGCKSFMPGCSPNCSGR